MTKQLPGSLSAGTWHADASHSEASFSVRHAGISKVRGTVNILSASIELDEDLSMTRVSAELDASSVDTRDAGRDAHLKSADFFEVEKFPVWTFASTGLEGDGEEGVLKGDLTIRGVTRPVELKVEFNGTAVDPYGNLRAGFSAETEISRKDFGLTWNAALEAGGVLVGDKVRINIELSAIKQA